jgi:hypothetical protein
MKERTLTPGHPIPGEGRVHVSHREVAGRFEPNIESEEVGDAIVERAVAGPVHLERAVVELHDAGVAVEGIAAAGLTAGHPHASFVLGLERE